MSYIPEYHENYYRVEGTAFNQGKIGIGTINPVQLLHVSGGNIRVDGTGYVNGDLNVSGNLNVYGTSAQFAVSQIIAEDKSIELNVATGSPIGGGSYTPVAFSNDAGAENGGITLKSTQGDKEILYKIASPNSGWVSNLRWIVSGNYGKDTLQLSDTAANVGLTIATDTNLYRSGANQLSTDDNLASTNNGGKITLQLTNTTADVGMTIGGDVNLYRSGANQLSTDDNFASTNNGGKTTLQLTNTTADVGITIGGDTNLYRSGANQLNFDDNLASTFNGGKTTFQLTNAAADVGMTIGGDVNLYRSGANQLNFDDNLASTFNGGKTTLQLTNTTANVGMTIGGDTNLYRSGIDTLRTDDNLGIVGNFNVDGNTTLGSDANDTVTINAGPVNLPNATSAADGLVIGGDAILYRSAANTLTVDDNVSINFNGGKTTLALVNTTTDVGLTIGADTNLYRSANDTLRTDDSLIVNTNFSVNGNTTLGDAYADTVLITGKVLRGILTYSGAAVVVQAGSTSIVSDKVIITGVGTADGALSLPAAIVGMEIEVKNRAGQQIRVYANATPGTDRIFDTSTLYANASALQMPSNTNKNFVCAPSGGINVWFT
jgi:hypothetical protein